MRKKTSSFPYQSRLGSDDDSADKYLTKQNQTSKHAVETTTTTRSSSWQNLEDMTMGFNNAVNSMIHAIESVTSGVVTKEVEGSETSADEDDTLVSDDCRQCDESASTGSGRSPSTMSSTAFLNTWGQSETTASTSSTSRRERGSGSSNSESYDNTTITTILDSDNGDKTISTTSARAIRGSRTTTTGNDSADTISTKKSVSDTPAKQAISTKESVADASAKQEATEKKVKSLPKRDAPPAKTTLFSDGAIKKAWTKLSRRRPSISSKKKASRGRAGEPTKKKNSKKQQLKKAVCLFGSSSSSRKQQENQVRRGDSFQHERTTVGETVTEKEEEQEQENRDDSFQGERAIISKATAGKEEDETIGSKYISCSELQVHSQLSVRDKYSQDETTLSNDDDIISIRWPVASSTTGSSTLLIKNKKDDPSFNTVSTMSKHDRGDYMTMLNTLAYSTDEPWGVDDEEERHNMTKNIPLIKAPRQQPEVSAFSSAFSYKRSSSNGPNYDEDEDIDQYAEKQRNDFARVNKPPGDADCGDDESTGVVDYSESWCTRPCTSILIIPQQQNQTRSRHAALTPNSLGVTIIGAITEQCY